MTQGLKRYDLVQVNACYTTDHEMEASDEGEWVRYEDVDPSVPLSAIRALVQQWEMEAMVAGQYSVECPINQAAAATKEAMTLARCSEQLAALCPAPPEDR